MPQWPNGARAAALFTFDFDAESGWLSRDPDTARRPGIMSQGRYGATVAVPRILEVLDAAAIKATFFIPGWVAEQHTDVCRAVRDAGHEIGHHGYVHERASPDDPEAERTAFAKGLAALETQLGVRPLGYRSPGWDLTPITLDLVRSAGMLYSSNLMDQAWPYLHADGQTVELPVQWPLDDAPFFMFHPQYVNRPIWPAQFVEEEWRESLRGTLEWGGLFNLTMHPQLSGYPSRLRMLRRLIDFAKAEDVWIATCAEAATQWRQSSA